MPEDDIDEALVSLGQLAVGAEEAGLRDELPRHLPLALAVEGVDQRLHGIERPIPRLVSQGLGFKAG